MVARPRLAMCAPSTCTSTPTASAGCTGCLKPVGWKCPQLRGGFSTPSHRSVPSLMRAASAGTGWAIGSPPVRNPIVHPEGPPCPCVSCVSIRHAAAPCARAAARGGAVGTAQKCNHQLTAHYYKTLPTGLKRLEEPRSGFSWSRAQKPVPLTLETKCLILKIINGKH